MVRHTNLTVLRERLVSAGGAPYEFDRITGDAGLYRWCAIRISYGAPPAETSWSPVIRPNSNMTVRGWSLQVVRHTNLTVRGWSLQVVRHTNLTVRGWSLQVVHHTNLTVLRERLVSTGGAPYEFDRITGEAGLYRWCATRI